MNHLMKLEIQRNKLTHDIWISFFAILFSILFITISLIDSATDPTQTKDSFDQVFQMIEILLSFIYIIFYAVLISSLIIKEYNTRTILIMFTYPIERKKLIGAKLALISCFIAVSLFFGYVCCCGYIVIVDHFFGLLAGSFEFSDLMDWMISMVSTIVVCLCIGFLTFVIGMFKKSVPMTIVASLILIVIRQVALSSHYGYTETFLQTLILAVFTVLCLNYSLNNHIQQVE